MVYNKLYIFYYKKNPRFPFFNNRFDSLYRSILKSINFYNAGAVGYRPIIYYFISNIFLIYFIYSLFYA